MTLLKYDDGAAVKELADILGVRRAAWSKTERRFIKTYIDDLPGVTVDHYGNRRVTVGGAKAPAILWSSHTDSVHHHGGVQSIIRDGDMIRLDKNEKQSNCLGADDGTGVWLMRNMILRGVPGHYIFHRDEESGGQGSSWVAKHDKKYLEQFQCAIALDRKGYHSVITHQGSRCASDAFAVSLASQLGGKFEPDSTGVFTDTANYTSIIPECTNLSVGYGGQHCTNEAQNVPFAIDLLNTLCELDVNALTIQRDPDVVEYDDPWWRGRGKSSAKWSDYYGTEFWDEWGSSSPSTKSYKTSSYVEYDRLLELVEAYPDYVADYLEQSGITARDLQIALGLK